MRSDCVSREKRRTLCLVTSGNLASNPRLTKEASALKTAEYDVRIVAADIIAFLSRYDTDVAAQLDAPIVTVRWHGVWPLRIVRLFKRAAARLWVRCFKHIPLCIAIRAHHALTPALTNAASRVPADLYIAHNLAALPAAAAAARRHEAKLGFDAEDYHCGELENTNKNALDLHVRRRIEDTLLSRCQYLTSASPQISAAYSADYGVEMLPILNVFPLSQAPREPSVPSSAGDGVRAMYWFSQTLGSNRGLEQMIDAVALMKTKVRLVLRGNASPDYARNLSQRARMKGGQDLCCRIELLPIGSPNDMVLLAAPFDLGLAIEPGHNRNNDAALSNKIFTYLLAGVPILLSRTTAQCRLAPTLAAAALLVDIHEPAQVAETLDDFFADTGRQRVARAEAWRLGRERFNWDIEKTRFLGAVERALG